MEINLDPAYLATLHKGDTIPAKVIRAASGCNTVDEEYRIAQLLVRGAVEKHFRDQGAIVVTRCRRHEVRILTDAEASVCCGDRTRHALRKMGRAKKGLEGVDTLKLTDGERSEHDNRLQQATFMYKAARKARAKAAVMEKLMAGD